MRVFPMMAALPLLLVGGTVSSSAQTPDTVAVSDSVPAADTIPDWEAMLRADSAAYANSVEGADEGAWAPPEQPSPAGGPRLQLPTPLLFGGQMTVTSDLYGSNGIDARRPGAVWQMNLTPQVSLFRAVTMNVDILLSSDESHFRQNISHLGLNPTWDWGAAHIGDFNRDYSPFILQGSRVRGAGLDLNPGAFRFSVQGGRLQRTVTAAVDGPVYRRNMVAASMGVGREIGTHLNLSVISGRDDIGNEEELVVRDTIPLDTIPTDLRPRVDTRPQENLAMGLDGQLVLFERLLTLSGAAAVSLYTRDLLADTVSPGEADIPLGGGVVEWLGERRPFRMSTSLDYAYEVEGTFALGGLRLRGGFEEVGPGYGSLGLPYLINDRRSYHVDAMSRLLDGRIAVQGQYRNQTNNLVDQKLNTVDRQTANGSVTARLSETIAATVTGLITAMSNDAPTDSARLDTRSLAATANTSYQREILGRASVLNLGYTIQRTQDENILAAVPNVTSHNVTGSVQVTLSPRFAVAPSLSAVLTDGEGVERGRDLLFGFRGTGNFLDEDLRTMANLSHSTSHGRRLSSGRFHLSYPVGWGADISFQARHNRYSAFGDRPAFQESFVTTAISRSF